MKVRTSLIGLLVACGIGVCIIGTAAAQPAGPPAGYKIDPEFTKTSPDGAITIEQYVNKDTDDWKFQFWARWQDTFRLLEPEQPDYPAEFLFLYQKRDRTDTLLAPEPDGGHEATQFSRRSGWCGCVAVRSARAAGWNAAGRNAFAWPAARARQTAGGVSRSAA
jgi:hypothetical protein